MGPVPAPGAGKMESRALPIIWHRMPLARNIPSTMEASRMFPYCANIVIVKELKLYHCVFDSKNAENEGKVYSDAKSREQ